MPDCGQIPGLRDGECVQIAIHKHWIVIIKTFFGLLFGILFVSGTALLLVKIFDSATANNYIILISLFLLLFVWLWGFVDLLDDELDSMVLTDQRVLDITQVGLFHIKFRETTLDLIEDATGSNDGILGNLLNFGILKVETSSTSGTLQIEDVPQPIELAREIMNRKNTFVHLQQAIFHNGDEPE